jgi:hypothetical protein
MGMGANGLSPLARALEHLTMLAAKTATVLVGNTPDSMADAYPKPHLRLMTAPCDLWMQ